MTNVRRGFKSIDQCEDEDLAADDVSEGQEHLHQLCVPELLGKMIDEEITPLRSTQGTSLTAKN